MRFAIKNLVFVLATCAFVSNAAANSLTVTNSTKRFISVRINGHCSKDFGIIQVSHSATVSEKALNNACGASKLRCLAQVFSSKNCDKIAVGQFIFNTASGPTGEGTAYGRYRISFKTNEVVFAE